MKPESTLIMAHLWHASIRVAKKIKFASDSKTAVDAKMKASIKVYGVATAAEELVKTQVTAWTEMKTVVGSNFLLFFKY